MARSYTLYADPGDEEGLVALREGFCWSAAIFGFLWALYYRMWWMAAALFGISASLRLVFFGEQQDITQIPMMIVVPILWFLILGEWGFDWRRRHLERCGWVMVGVICAPNATVAQVEYLRGVEG